MPGRGPYHTASMSGDLPNFLDLSKVGRAPVAFAGRIELQQLPRLCKLAHPDGDAAVRLQVADEQGRRRILGQIRADVELTCQRCLGPVRYPVAADVHLVWAHTGDEAALVPEGYDAIVSVSGCINVRDLVEDELLLALPLVARHEAPEDCRGRVAVHGPQHATDEVAPGPFAVLKTLKRH